MASTLCTFDYVGSRWLWQTVCQYGRLSYVVFGDDILNAVCLLASSGYVLVPLVHRLPDGCKAFYTYGYWLSRWSRL